MKKITPFGFILSLFVSISSNTFAQAPAIEWEKSYGGGGIDRAKCIRQTPDHGFIIAGDSRSDNDEVTGHHGVYTQADAWIVKIDSVGNLQWEHSYGGSEWDDAVSIRVTSDGGYIFTGKSYSKDGDVTGHHGTTQLSDVWVVKLDAEGNIVWERSYGGSSADIGYDILQTQDQGYIVAASTFSSDGDVTGNHGGYDYWIIKLNPAGDIQWKQCYGGSSNEEPCSILQLNGGDYFVAGYSISNNGEVTGHHGPTSNSDVWIIKINKNGKLVGEASLPNFEDQTPWSACLSNEGGYMIAGIGGGFPTHGIVTYGWGDFMLMKVSRRGKLDTACAMGGSGNDGALSIAQTHDGGYILAGQTLSYDYDVTGYHGGGDYWVVKVDSLLKLQWEEALGGTFGDVAYSVQQAVDGGYIVAGESDSYSEQVSGNHGSSDYWIVKLAPDKIHGVATSGEETVKRENKDHQIVLSVLSNPAINHVEINYSSSSNGILELDDLAGRKLSEQRILSGNGNTSMNVANIPGGTYLLKLITSTNQSTSKIQIIH
jgi:hypothetical protein